MPRRLPIIPTIIVAAAVAVMIGLGVWQVQRAAWKTDLIAQHRAARTRPVLDGLPTSSITRGDIARDDAARRSFEELSFRRTTLTCTLRALDGKLKQIGGRSLGGSPGFRNIAGCSTNPLGGRLLVDLGWSPPGKSIAAPDGARATFTGQLNPAHELADRMNPDPDNDPIPFLLVAENAWPGLQASAPSDPDALPNNHFSYAVQWFAFSAVALIIYVLALSKRSREAGA